MQVATNKHKKHTIESIKQYAAAEKYKILSVIYRNPRKNLLCSKNNIALIRVECDEPLTIECVRGKIAQIRSTTNV